MSAGIALESRSRYGDRFNNREFYKKLCQYNKVDRLQVGRCYKLRNKFGVVDYFLITKIYARDKPSISNYNSAWTSFLGSIQQETPHSIALPWIGCGLDNVNPTLFLHKVLDLASLRVQYGWLGKLLNNTGLTNLKRPINITVYGRELDQRALQEAKADPSHLLNIEYPDDGKLTETTRLLMKNVKVFEIPRLITFNDGDDTTCITKCTDAKIIADGIANVMAMFGPILRYGTNSGVKLCKEFGDMNFCSNNYQPILTNESKTARQINKEYKIFEILKRDPQTRFKLFVELAVKTNSKLWYLPYRPVPDIIGKLCCTLKGKTAHWDPNNPDCVEITRGKIMSYLLMYPHLRSVRFITLALLSSWRRDHRK